MKKRIVSMILAIAMILAVVPATVFAAEAKTLEGNLLKVTSVADFGAGTATNLIIDPSVGNGALKLAAGATEGVFESAVYETDDWAKGVASWSAGMYDGGWIEVWARARVNGEWTDYMTWGAYSPYISRGTTSNKDCALAKISTDVFTIKNSALADAVQMKVVLSRSAADVTSPEVRQIAMSFTGGTMQAQYTETALDEIPAKKFNPAPGYCQSGRSEIGGSMCSPTTVSVMLNSRNPQLNIIPEALANATEDNAASSYSFGNWSFCASIPGLYGYDCYMQYASKEIMLQELAQGRTMGISVAYSKAEGGSYPYLQNAYSNTGGHLISIIGYEYEDGIMDDEHLYFISSDSYSSSAADLRDTDVYRRYKWTQLDECWDNRVAYMIPALEPETGACTNGVTRVDATLKQDENDSTLFVMVDAQGNPLDMSHVSSGERVILAYTVEGFKSAPAAANSYAIAYEKAIQVEANNTFIYAGITLQEDGKLAFNANQALIDLGLRPNDPRTVTVYAMGSEGYIYAASAKISVMPDKTVVVTPAGSSVVSSEKDGKTQATLGVDNLDGDLTVGVLIPEGGDVNTAVITINGVATEIIDTYTDANGVKYAVIKLDPAVLQQTVVATWGDKVDTYVYDLSDVVVEDETVVVEKGNVIEIDMTTGKKDDQIVGREDGSLTLKEGATEGVYTSPVYDSFDWEYAMGFLGAYTPTGSSVDLQIRAFSQKGQVWGKWLSMGSAGDGSTSISEQDDHTNMSTDIYMMRGSSSVANAQRFQLRLVLKSKDGSVLPAVYNAGVTFKKELYNPSEAEPLSKLEELPASAGKPDAEAYSAYAYGAMGSWRFENMELIMLNAQGADLLFEQVAFANYDHNAGWGNWAMTNYKPGAFGYYAYTQFGASSALVQQALAAGNMVGLYVHGGYVPGTNSNKSSQTVVVGYYTKDDGTVMFNVICPRGDTSELAAGKVYGEISAADLDAAIQNFNSGSSGNARGLMYVVGTKQWESSIQEEIVDEIIVDPEYPDNYKNEKGGVIAYVLKSEVDGEAKRAAAKFYYDIIVNEDGTLSLPESVPACDTAIVFAIGNNGITQITTMDTHTWDEGEVTTKPGCESEGEKTYHCTVEGCEETKTEKIEATGHAYGEYVSDGNATCTQDGTKTAVCGNDASHTDTIADEGSATGVHTYEDGVCTGCGAEAPSDTGDHAQPMLWAALMALAAAALALLVSKKKALQK